MLNLFDFPCPTRLVRDALESRILTYWRWLWFRGPRTIFTEYRMVLRVRRTVHFGMRQGGRNTRPISVATRQGTPLNPRRLSAATPHGRAHPLPSASRLSASTGGGTPTTQHGGSPTISRRVRFSPPTQRMRASTDARREYKRTGPSYVRRVASKVSASARG